MSRRDEVRGNPHFRALSIVFGQLGRLRFWPGDRVRVRGGGLSGTFLCTIYGHFHIVSIDDGHPGQLCPDEAVTRISTP